METLASVFILLVVTVLPNTHPNFEAAVMATGSPVASQTVDDFRTRAACEQAADLVRYPIEEQGLKLVEARCFEYKFDPTPRTDL